MSRLAASTRFLRALTAHDSAARSRAGGADSPGYGTRAGTRAARARHARRCRCRDAVAPLALGHGRLRRNERRLSQRDPRSALVGVMILPRLAPAAARALSNSDRVWSRRRFSSPPPPTCPSAHRRRARPLCTLHVPPRTLHTHLLPDTTPVHDDVTSPVTCHVRRAGISLAILDAHPPTTGSQHRARATSGRRRNPLPSP